MEAIFMLWALTDLGCECTWMGCYWLRLLEQGKKQGATVSFTASGSISISEEHLINSVSLIWAHGALSWW